MSKPLKSLIIIASVCVVSMGFAALAEAGSGKCRSTKTPNPKSGACVGIKNCNHDQSKEDSQNLNSPIRRVAACMISSARTPMTLVSGYRCSRGSPGCRKGNLPFNGGADCSQHLRGNAIDASFRGLSLAQIQSYALACGARAAVKYPCYGFVHFDTGNARSWATCGSGRPDKIVRMQNIFAKVNKRRG